MPKNKRQHYVPQFYLRSFGDNKVVDLALVDDARVIRGAPINRQCYENYFYGEDGAVEEWLSHMESIWSGTIKSVIGHQTDLSKVQPNSEEWVSFVAFVSVQVARTLATAQMTEDVFEAVVRGVMVADAPDPEILNRLKLQVSNPINVTMRRIVDTACALNDLRAITLCASTPSFLTSDSPVSLYNKFSEDVRGRGVLGYSSSGLQVIIPLSNGEISVKSLGISGQVAYRRYSHFHKKGG